MHRELYLGWFNYFFAWVKFFFIPNLRWWCYGDLPNYDRLQADFAQMQAWVGTARAKVVIFEEILASFLSEAQWHKPSGKRPRKPRTERAADPGLPGRILRVLRQSGEDD